MFSLIWIQINHQTRVKNILESTSLRYLIYQLPLKVCEQPFNYAECREKPTSKRKRKGGDMASQRIIYKFSFSPYNCLYNDSVYNRC